MRKPVIAVLGMHRSGSSAIAKGMECLGTDLGTTLIAPGADNPKGYFEDQEILGINMALMTRLNLAWNDLRHVDEQRLLGIQHADLKREAATLLGRKSLLGTPWGFKDPRTVRLLPFWLQAAEMAEVDWRFLIAVRHPLAVAASLQHRNKMSQARAILMWCSHLIPFLDRVQSFPHVFVAYDQVLTSPATEIHRIADALQLPMDLDQLERYQNQFLDRQLRHHDQADTPDDQGTWAMNIADRAQALLSGACSKKTDSGFWQDWQTLQKHYWALEPLLRQLDQDSDHHRKQARRLFYLLRPRQVYQLDR